MTESLSTDFRLSRCSCSILEAFCTCKLQLVRCHHKCLTLLQTGKTQALARPRPLLNHHSLYRQFSHSQLKGHLISTDRCLDIILVHIYLHHPLFLFVFYISQLFVSTECLLATHCSPPRSCSALVPLGYPVLFL